MMLIQERTILCLRVVCLVGSAANVVHCARRKTGKKDILLNTNPSQDLNIALCVQFFCSSWREIDHTPELILNHSTPDALSGLEACVHC